MPDRLSLNLTAASSPRFCLRWDPELAEVKRDGRLRDSKLLADANGIFHFLDDKFPDYAGYSPVMTECFWMAYQATGDINYLSQDCRVRHGQRSARV